MSILGASSGIGKRTAELFYSLGASLLLTGRNQQTLDEVVHELSASKKSNQKVATVIADFSREEDVKKVFEVLKTKFDNKLDILVNNAGVLERGNILDTTLEQYDRVMDVNVRALYQTTMLAAPLLIKTKGSIVNISSVNGIRAVRRIASFYSF